MAPTLDAGRVSLVKGSRVSLVKSGAPALTTVMMGLGWDPARGNKAVDLDASAIAFDQSGRKLAIVWFTNLGEYNGALRHAGDNLTGQGDGDDEQIYVDLDRVPVEVASIVFTITSFRGQKFTEIARAFCRLVDVTTGQELVRYDLSGSEARSGVVMAMLRRTPSGVWEMRAIGEFHDARTVKKLVDPAARWAVAP
jgi:stress response protein SCP2